MSPLVPYTRKGENFAFSPKTPEPERQNLLYSVDHNFLRHPLCLHVEESGRDYSIVEGPYPINNLAVLGDKLFFSDNRFSNSAEPMGRIVCLETKEEVYRHSDFILGMVAHDGDLICSDKNRIFGAKKTRAPLWIGRRISELAILGGRLIHSEWSNPSGIPLDIGQEDVRYTKTGALIGSYGGSLRAMVAEGEDLIVAKGNREIVRGADEVIATRRDHATSLAIYNGHLIDAGKYRAVCDTESGEQFIETLYPILALLPIDQKTTDRLLTLPGVKEIR
jgi:hypothetical protein